MSFEKESPVVLVTGSTSGIGANIALDLSKIGCRVIIIGRDQIRLNRIMDECRNDSVHPFKVDLMDTEQIDDLLEWIKEKFGHLDILINNACFRGEIRNIIDTPRNEFEKVYQMNVTAPLYLIHKSMKLLRKPKKHTQIVMNISSTASRVVVPLHAYSISKSCLSELTQRLRHINGLLTVTISPGPVLTEDRPQHAAMKTLTLIDRVGTPQEISNVVIHCLKNINLFNGHEIFVDGGYLAREHVKCCLGN